jgi:hypothetical protein
VDEVYGDLRQRSTLTEIRRTTRQTLAPVREIRLDSLLRRFS